MGNVEGLTACVTLADGRAVAVLPLAIRDVRLGPSETCKVAFLHAVGTHPDWRGKGVGSALMRAAGRILGDRVEALMVYRTGGERTAGYAFYKKAGFHELMFATTCLLGRPGVSRGDVTATSGEQAILGEQETLRALFIASFGERGGYWAREPRFYERALRSSYFLSRPHDFLLLQARIHGSTSAYALLGRAQSSQDLKILEMAALPGKESAVAALLDAACEHAGQGELSIATSAESPLWPVIQPWVNEASIRSPVLLGKVLDPAARAAGLTGTPCEFPFTIWTPSGDFPVGKPVEKGPVLALKDDALQRLLFRRLRLRHALANEQATLHGVQDGDAARFDEAIPSHSWVYHALDYL